LSSPEKRGRFLFVVETAELLNIFLIILMALFFNAQGHAEFTVQILCLLMNRRDFQTFDVGCANEKGCVGNHLTVSSITARKSSMNVDCEPFLVKDR
jgi:high-affinity K+ transport system ATPase subunit B